jgi:hypothetical protein
VTGRSSVRARYGPPKGQPKRLSFSVICMQCIYYKVLNPVGIILTINISYSLSRTRASLVRSHHPCTPPQVRRGCPQDGGGDNCKRRSLIFITIMEYNPGNCFKCPLKNIIVHLVRISVVL